MSASFQKSIRFASVNIERNKHLGRVVPFLKNFKPDALCLQEILECDIALFEKELDMHYTFVPESRMHVNFFDLTTPLTSEGVAIFTSVPPVNVRTDYYRGNPGEVPIYSKDEQGNVTSNFILLSVEAIFGNVSYTFSTTHFIWTRDGMANDEQREDIKKILGFFENMPEFILAGDFNAPRGREIFSEIASRYKDNIPAHYTTSIDKNFHKAGDLQLMVDCLFSTPQYEVSDVKLNEGVSDHMAITALVAKRV